MEVKGEFHLISKMYSRLDFFLNLLTSPLVLANFDSDEQLKLKSVAPAHGGDIQGKENLRVGAVFGFCCVFCK